MTAPHQLSTRDKVRDALWRYAPERTEKIATVGVIAAAAALAITNWLRKGKYQ